MQLLFKRRRSGSTFTEMREKQKEAKLIKGNSYHYYNILLHLLYHNYYHILCDTKLNEMQGCTLQAKKKTHTKPDSFMLVSCVN